MIAKSPFARAGLIVLFCFAALAQIAAQSLPEGSVTLRRIEISIDGRTQESALRDFLDIEESQVFSSEAELAEYVASLDRKLKNERLFDTASNARYTLDPGGTSAVISVYVRDSINALAVPFPTYSGSDGLVLAVRYKDFNFLGSMEALAITGDYYFDGPELNVGTDFGLPFSLWGGAWHSSLSADVSLAEGVDPVPNVNAALSAAWQAEWLGLTWSYGPAFSYAYLRAYDRHTLAASTKLTAAFPLSFGLSAYLQPSYTYVYDDEDLSTLKAALGVNASFTAAELPWVGPLLYKPTGQLYLTALSPLYAADDLAFVAGQALSLGRVDLAGNFRHGFSAAISSSYGYHFLEAPGDEHDLSFSLNAGAYYSLGNIAGLNLRATGRWFADWTLWGQSSSYNWWELVRGKSGAGYGDAGLIVNAELPINFAQGLFFDSPTFEAEVHLNFFVDAGFVRADPTLPLLDDANKVFCGGVDAIVYPAKARAFTYRLSVGYDLNDYLLSRDLKTELLEIWLGLGLHF
jgi:hypothetical protein